MNYDTILSGEVDPVYICHIKGIVAEQEFGGWWGQGKDPKQTIENACKAARQVIKKRYSERQYILTKVVDGSLVERGTVNLSTCLVTIAEFGK